MVEIKIQPEVTQTLELLLSPRMLQMLNVLSLSYTDLVNRITKEAEENVMLDVERRDEYVEIIRYLSSDKKIKKQADFEELPGLEKIGRVSKTLEEHLLEQLELEDLEKPYYKIAKIIIGYIDDFGYVINYPKLQKRIMKDFSVSRPTVDKALKIVQGFEPEGIGARNLKECLLIQIQGYNFEEKELQQILVKAVKTHLKDLGHQNFGKVARDLGITESGAAGLADFIKKNLNPNPGSSFGGETKHVIPSFAVEKTEKGFKVINLENRYGPIVNISSRYLEILENPKTDEKTREFLREKFKTAKNLIEDFLRRSETLEKIVRKIIETQEEFLTKGVTWLRPLTQKSLADEFGLHPSTISRTVAEKYIQTSLGTFPLRFLCPRGPKGLTVTRIKAMLVEIVKNEDKSRPLSDSQITEIMKELGARIDRRTVAYYRNELKMPTWSERAEK
jgi:RNA polymerase sigma-54 factor